MEPNEKGEGVKKQETIPTPLKKRQIIIETDGNDINLVKAEVAGKIELIAIFQMIIEYLRTNNQSLDK